LPESRKIEITRNVKFLESNLNTPRFSSEDCYPEDTFKGEKVVDNNINVEMFSERPGTSSENLKRWSRNEGKSMKKTKPMIKRRSYKLEKEGAPVS